MKKFTKIISIIMLFVLCATLIAGCGNKEEVAKKVEEQKEVEAAADGKIKLADTNDIKEKGKMVIGYTIYEPMNYEENGELTGFDTEFAKAVCEKLGVTPEFVVINWDTKFIELKSKSIDCIWNGMTITEEAQNSASVSKPYVKNAQVVVMKKTDIAKYSDVESLKGLSFAAEAGSAGEKAIEESGLKENYVAVAAQTDALLEVMSGSVDACVIDITMANAMTGEGTSYSSLASGLELTTEEYGIAFRQGSDLTDNVNAIIDELKADGTLDALAEKYSLTLAF